eukprot:jgi/Tetstr1/464019/TSEL_008824.t1
MEGSVRSQTCSAAAIRTVSSASMARLASAAAAPAPCQASASSHASTAASKSERNPRGAPDIRKTVRSKASVMELSSKTFEEVRLRAEKALREPALELEARFTSDEKSLDRVGFERVLRYLRRTKAVHEPEHETLDIGMSAHRVTIADVDRIAEQCARWNQQTLVQMYEASPDDIIVIRKEPVHKRVDIPEYNVIVWLKMETAVQDPTDPLKAMSASGRLLTFRLKKRYSFLSDDKAFRIDCTVVKSATGAKSVDALVGAKETFEVEVELLEADSLAPPQVKDRAKVVATALMTHVAELLTVMRDQRSGPLMTSVERSRVKNEYIRLTGGRIVMPKPVTLEKGNLLEETADNYSVRPDGGAGRYTVTDKADGARCLLFVDAAGRGYLIDDRGGIVRTGVDAPGAANSVLDGELVKRSRLDAPLNLYLVFDVYWFRGKDVRHLPLVDLDGGDGPTRMRHMRPDGELGAALSRSRDPAVRAKEFVPLRSAKRMYDAYTGAGGPEYAVDGLILTPEKLAVFQERIGQAVKPRNSAWSRVYKWKPPKDNSVDFHVQYEKTSNGDLVVNGGRLRARLQVNVHDVARGADPYQILTGVAVEKTSTFRAFEAPDYGMKVPDNPDSVGAGVFVHPGRELPQCAHPPHDTVLDESIVEFAWDSARGAWTPLRVRHDKTYPNKLETAMSVWRSIAYPIEVEDIVDPTRVENAGAGAKDDVYFDEVTAGDGAATGPMRRFHRSWILDRMLYARAAAFARQQPQQSLRLLDLACGRGGDINSWIGNGFDVVVGVDLFEDNLIGKAKTAAYARFAKARDLKRNADLKLRYAFVPMDASKRVGKDAVEDIGNPSLKKIAQALWRTAKAKPDPKLSAYEGLALQPFDVVSCQFAAHYFFETEAKLDAFLDNVADNLRPGGLFIGTCTDGAATAAELEAAERDAVSGTAIEALDAGGNLVWRVEKRYEDGDESAFGRAVAVYVETINKVNIEYLVDFGVMTSKLEKRGLRLLNAAELDSYGLPASSALFSDVYADTDWASLARDARRPYEASVAAMVLQMTEDLKRFSFLSRYFVFVKK